MFATQGSTQQQQGSNLFGSLNSGAGNQQPKLSLFGTSVSQPVQQAQQQPSSLFGSLGAQQQQGAATGAQQTGSLFGQPQPQQQSQGLFGGLNASAQAQQPMTSSILGQPQPQPQPQQQSRFGGSLWMPGASISPREKSVPEQMQIVLEKWSPESSNCLFQHYFYNHVPPEHVPYYGPAPGEDEKKWEEALSKKPSEGSIPVLAKGFSALAQRLRTQVQAVSALQVRLHEINNSLAAMMQNHDLVISVRAADAKRRHAVISQRCLSLAGKVQVLRNRGYIMDNAEEELKKKLAQLERGVLDPAFSGRAEEIWARMMGVRERARIIREEFERTGDGKENGQENGIDEEVLKKTKQILNDYDSQLSHLKKEMDTIRKDFEDWQEIAANGGSRGR